MWQFGELLYVMVIRSPNGFVHECFGYLRYFAGYAICEYIYTLTGGRFNKQNPKIMHTHIHLEVFCPSQTALASWQFGKRHLEKKK